MALFSFYCLSLEGQGLNKAHQFLAYDQIPTWKGLASDWNKSTPKIHLFDVKKYKGHGNFVCYGLKTGLLFKQFKELVRHPEKREYLPLFLYDLRTKPIYKNGQKYTWALRLEDYSYQDDHLSMEKTFVRLMKAVEQYMQREDPNAGKGIAVLASPTASLPNRTIRGGVEQEGYAVLSLGELIAATKSGSPEEQKTPLLGKNNDLSTTILNEGIAIGYLRWVKEGQEAQVKSDFKNILLYQNIPHRVPIANGILTMTPQTPFSHVNLLAKNRGTINAYFTRPLPNDFLKQYENELVQITAKKIQGTSTFTITKITQKEANASWAIQKKLKVVIPKPDLSVQSFSHFATGARSVQTIACIGAKASNYALLYHHLPSYTRPGFAIPFYFYVKTIKSCGAEELIERLLKNKDNWSLEERKQALATIRNKIATASLDARIFKELEVICTTYYKGKKLRLRSSTNCEDLPAFNGAGLYVSKGFWEGSDQALIQKKILEVYASLWLDRAFEEREFFGIDQEKVAMGILINEAFPDEYANGVALTLPNAVGTPTIHINTQYGERSVTNPEGTAQPEVIYFRQLDSKWYVTVSKSSVQNIFVENPSLTPLVRQLQQASAQIDGLLKRKTTHSDHYGVDIEFKIMKEATGFKLYLKQARLLQVDLPE
ncbi:MAG: PEP/pyruvate-binding domain-containing protein [Aureispira sp.]